MGTGSAKGGARILAKQEKETHRAHCGCGGCSCPPFVLCCVSFASLWCRDGLAGSWPWLLGDDDDASFSLSPLPC